MTAQSETSIGTRRSLLANEQIVATKALGTPHVYVEALDPDGNKVVEKVESEVALLWPFVHKEVVVSKHGKVIEDPVQLPKQVGQDILALLLEYCRYHRFPGRSDKERKIFDEKFIRLDTRRLCELTSAADSLDMKPLVDLSSRALARMIEGKTPEEIRETFHLPDDLTEEEKLEPVKNVADDPRIRLLNRLYAKKRKELAEKKAELQRREAGIKGLVGQSSQETRSVEELLSFIEAERQEGGKARSKKKKAKKKREASTSTERAPGVDAGTDAPAASSLLSSPGRSSPNSMQRGESCGLGQDESSQCSDIDNLDDAEMDDEIEAFARNINTEWEDRRAELILMAGAFPSRPTRVTNLTSLSNFRARPREAPAEADATAPDFPGPQPQKAETSAISSGAPGQTPLPRSTPLEAQPTGQARAPARDTASPVRPFMGGQTKGLGGEAGGMTEGKASSDEADGKASPSSAAGKASDSLPPAAAAALAPQSASLTSPAQSPGRKSKGLGKDVSGAGGPQPDGHTNGVGGGGGAEVGRAGVQGSREAGEAPEAPQSGREAPEPAGDSKESSQGTGKGAPDNQLVSGGSSAVATRALESDQQGTTAVEAAEKAAGESKVPLRTLLEGWFPHPKPTADPATERDSSTGASTTGAATVGESHRAEGKHSGDAPEGVRAGALAIPVGVGGFEGGLAGQEGGESHLTDGSCQVDGLRSGGDTPGAEASEKGTAGLRLSDAAVAHESEGDGLSGTVEVDPRVDQEALAALLRDFVRELGCEGVISIRALSSSVDLGAAVSRECIVEGVVSGLGPIRLLKSSNLESNS